MERLLIIGGVFVVAGLCEIGGGYLVWGWMREHKPIQWALAGGLILAVYGVVAALQPISEFGRTYAAYGGIFIALALVWGIVVDGFRPDRYDVLGALICVVGVVIMVTRHGNPRQFILVETDHQHQVFRHDYSGGASWSILSEGRASTVPVQSSRPTSTTQQGSFGGTLWGKFLSEGR